MGKTFQVFGSGAESARNVSRALMHYGKGSKTFLVFYAIQERRVTFFLVFVQLQGRGETFLYFIHFRRVVPFLFFSFFFFSFLVQLHRAQKTFCQRLILNVFFFFLFIFFLKRRGYTCILRRKKNDFPPPLVTGTHRSYSDRRDCHLLSSVD